MPPPSDPAPGNVPTSKKNTYRANSLFRDATRRGRGLLARHREAEADSLLGASCVAWLDEDAGAGKKYERGVRERQRRRRGVSLRVDATSTRGPAQSPRGIYKCLCLGWGATLPGTLSRSGTRRFFSSAGPLHLREGPWTGPRSRVPPGISRAPAPLRQARHTAFFVLLSVLLTASPY